jgi:mannose-P-dolichol utilization defect protein 1
MRSLYLLSLIAYAGVSVLDILPEKVYIISGSSSIVLISIARLSQIYISYSNKDTGPLSVFTFFLALAGTIARIFTTFTETKDLLVIMTFVWSGFLTTIIIIQIFVYGNKAAKVKVAGKTE